MRNNDEFCIIEHEELCVKNEELCITNEKFCIQNDEFCSDKAGNKAQMVWNTTDNATTKEDNDLRKILDKPHFDWQGHDFHELQALRLSKLQRRRNEEARFADDSELVCLQLAARVRERIPSFWTSERQLTFIQDVDVWLLLEAKYEMISRWRMKVVQQDGSVSPTPATGGKLGGGMPRNRGGGYSVRGMDVEEVNPSWVVAQLRDWDRHTDSALKILRTSPRSLLGSTLNVGAEEREPECELMYLWKRILEVKRGGDGTDVMALTLEEQDWLDHSSVFMSSRLTENEHDAQTCKNNIKAYRETLNTSIEPARLYNENLIRIMNRIPEIDGRPLTADEELKLGALKLAVLDSKEKDYKEFLKEKEKDPATLTAVKQKEWRANLKRLEDAKLDEQEQVDLDSLKRQKYDRIFKGVKLKELRPMAIIAKPFDKFEQLWTDDEKAEFEQQKAEQKAKDDQEAYLGLLDDPAYADALTTEQVASRKMLQLLRFYRLKRMGAFDPWSDPPRGDQADLLEYQDLQKTELDRRKDGGEELTPDENQERDQLWVSVLQREARETLTIDEAETLYALLKAQLSDNKRDEELLEWLDMRRNQLHLQKMKEKAHAAGKAEENLEEDVKYVAQLIGFEQANIKVLERHQFDADFSDQKDLDLLKAKQAVRAKAKNEKNMKQTVAEGLELIELTKSIQIGLEAPSRLERTSDQSSVAVFEQIQQTIEKLEVEELIGMRTETEEDILDKLYVRQLEWKLMRIADSLVKEVSECSPVGSGDGGGSGEGEDEESLKARREELAGERERTAYELERRQRTILVREKAHAARDLKEAVKEVGRRETELKEQKELGDTGALQSPREKPAGDAEAGGETGSEMEPGEVVDAIREVDEQDQADLSYVEHEMSKANEDVSQKRADMDRIDAELDQLLLQDLERRKEKGLLNSDEEHQLDVQIKRVLKRKEHAGELSPVDMQKLMDAELRLLERKDGNQKEFLDDDEQIELDLRRFHSLSQKKIHDGGFTVSDEKMLESVIVAIYTRRKVYAKQQAMKLATEISMEGAESTADGDGGAGKQHAKLIFDEQLWSSDEDLDLKRYELKQLERQSETKQLDVADVEMVYNLRCEMIDGLEERIKGRKDILAMERGFTSLNISGLRHVPEPEPEPEPELEPDPEPPIGTASGQSAAAPPLLHPLTKEPLFLPSAGAAANGGPAPTARYRVHFKRVAIRSGASRDALVIGAMDEGAELEACGQEGNWVKLTPGFWPAGADFATGAWMMLDGTVIGLGVLLKQLQLKNSRWDWRVQRDADGRFKLLPPKLPPGGQFSAGSGYRMGTGGGRMVTPANITRYSVVHAPRVAIRSGASVTERIIGAAHHGSEIVTCGREGNWVRLTAACWIRLTGRTVCGAAWMMVDGSKVGLGALLLKVDGSQQTSPVGGEHVVVTSRAGLHLSRAAPD